ncbi:MAG TPA: WecB/TagA/CpsF family glycosyltransferase [Elusimicrobiota bacterium]|nr:WecB/TagA/CpsF family glycosyltransferase [Elusimicrobiota bacterium]
MIETFPICKIAGIPFHAVTWADMDLIVSQLMKEPEGRYLTVVNSYSVVVSQNDVDFFQALLNSHLILADSIPVVWLSRLIDRPLPERIAGPDLHDFISRLAEKNGWSVFYLGASPSTLDQLKANLQKRFPALNIAGVYSPPMKAEFNDEDTSAMIEAIQRARPDIVWVGLTAPKQEKWLFRNLKSLRCHLAVGIGAAFEFTAGTRTRAPRWIQVCGFEWLHRLLHEPRRLWKRYLIGNTIFLLISFREIIQHWIGSLFNFYKNDYS